MLPSQTPRLDSLFLVDAMTQFRMLPAAIASLMVLTPVLMPLPSLAQATPTPETQARRQAKRQTHFANGLIFETPVGFSEVKSLGKDTVGVVAQKGSRKLKIRNGNFDGRLARASQHGRRRVIKLCQNHLLRD